MTKSTTIGVLEKFLTTDGESDTYVIDAATISQMDESTVGAINAINAINQSIISGAAKFPYNWSVHIEKVDGGFKYIKRRLPSIYKDGDEDKRTQEGRPDPHNPFRPRYRKLSQPELDHHDAIKTQATILLGLFEDTANVRTNAGQSNDGFSDVMPNLKLAQRHLEDAVYRAVKALTA